MASRLVWRTITCAFPTRCLEGRRLYSTHACSLHPLFRLPYSAWYTLTLLDIVSQYGTFSETTSVIAYQYLSLIHRSSITYIRVRMDQKDYGLPRLPPDDREAVAASSDSSLSPEPNNMSSIPTPSTETSTSPNQRYSVAQIRRDRTLPKNSNGEIYCDHQDCATDPPTFRRPCEWNKHMDRHERPYKCEQPGCEMSQGFTYSGGLLRHKREVHKMHLTVKEPLYCPYPGCNRGGAPGFTRKENLEEHKRRRHMGEPAESLNGYARKRKRLITPQLDVDDYNNLDEGDYPTNVDVSNYAYVKRLHTELVQTRTGLAARDNMIRELKMEIKSLQNVLGNIPTQTIYGVNANMMSPPTSLQTPGNQMMHRNGSSPLT